MNDLIEHATQLHTTEMGLECIKRNLDIDTDDIVQWCRVKILADRTIIERKGKNWYATIDDCQITVNAHSYTIITARKIKK